MFDLKNKGLLGSALRAGTDWHGNFNFSVELEGVFVAQFKSVSGLGAKVDTVEYRSGLDRNIRKRPGQAHVNNITLKRGVMLWGHDSMWKWFKKAMEGHVERKSGSIVMRDDRLLETFRFNFYEAWPCSWKGWELDGDGRAAVVEEVELVCERIERFPIPGPGVIL